MKDSFSWAHVAVLFFLVVILQTLLKHDMQSDKVFAAAFLAANSIGSPLVRYLQRVNGKGQSYREAIGVSFALTPLLFLIFESTAISQCDLGILNLGSCFILTIFLHFVADIVPVPLTKAGRAA